MAGDKPAFLHGVDEDLPAVLLGTEDTPKTPESEIKPEDKEVVEKPAEEIKPEEELKPDEKKPEEPTEVTPAKKEGPVKPEEKKPEELILGKFKTQEDFEKSHKELERTLTNLQTELKQYKEGKVTPPKNDSLAPLLKTPLITPEIPDPKFYKLSDQTFDIQSYLRDFSKNFSVALQGSFLRGPMGSAMFGLLQEALTREQTQGKEAMERDAFALDVWNKVQEKYPILAKNQDLQDAYTNSIYGLSARKAQEAKANGVEYVPPTADELMDLARKIVAGQQIVTEQPEEKTEPLRTDTPMTTEPGAPVDPTMQAIRDMQNLQKNKSSLF